MITLLIIRLPVGFGMIAKTWWKSLKRGLRSVVYGITSRMCFLFTLVSFHYQCYTCGSRKVAEGVREVLTKIIKDKDNLEDEKATALFHRAVDASRYATDIFD